MKTRGNTRPNPIHIDNYPLKEGFVEVRLRTNITDISKVYSVSDANVTMYEYEEYTLRLMHTANLREKIENNLSDWIATGRILESEEGATIVI